MINLDAIKHVHRLPRGLTRFVDTKINHRPVLVNLELTKACNAKCHFCTCWTVENHPQLADYADVIKTIRPVVVSVNGGEPLLRRDIVKILRNIRPHCIYLAIITNGSLLTLEKSRELRAAGLDQITISLDYLSDQHNEVRVIDNLFKHISTLVPQIVADGFDNVVLNTIIMQSNLDHLVPLAKQADEWGIKISFSAYSSNKADNHSEMISPENLAKLGSVVEELKAMKRERGHIMASEYFFDHVVPYFTNKAIGGCKAGQKWVTVTPDGYIQPCSETARVCHYTEYDPSLFGDIDCDVCWYACRAESQAPVTVARVKEWVRG